MSNVSSPEKAPSNVDAPRRPYEPPAIEETSEFETLALNCTGLANADVCGYLGGTYTNS
jgi:hypothetical protein